DFAEKDLKGDLREAGITKKTMDNLVQARESAAETLGQSNPSGRASGALSNSKPLERFGRDLTTLAAAGELMPVIGRDDEIRRVVQTLNDAAYLIIPADHRHEFSRCR